MPVQSLKETVYRSENIHQQKLKADETKNEATILALWLRGKKQIDVFNPHRGKAGGGVSDLHVTIMGAVRQYG